MKRYEPIEPALLDEEHDHWLFQSIADHLQDLLGQEWHPVENIERMQDVPGQAKHVWYAWSFAAEVGGGGIYSYVVHLPQSARALLNTLDALVSLGDRDMTDRLTSGIALSAPEKPRFWDDQDASTLASLEVTPDYPDFEAVDKGIYERISEPFSASVASYIRKHRHIL